MQVWGKRKEGSVPGRVSGSHREESTVLQRATRNNYDLGRQESLDIELEVARVDDQVRWGLGGGRGEGGGENRRAGKIIVGS